MSRTNLVLFPRRGSRATDVTCEGFKYDMWRSSAERDIDDHSPSNSFFVFIDTATFLRQLSLPETVSSIPVNTRASNIVSGLLV
jgi:hypothetical protein